MSNPKVAIGFIAYEDITAKYLPYFLPSVLEQSFTDFNIFVIDNGASQINETQLAKYHEINYERAGTNLGFAKAANRLLAKAKASGADYFFLVNPDTILDKAAVSELVKFMKANQTIAAASPKILRWDFASKAKTKIIDTCGLALRFGFKFIDVGQGEIDDGRFDLSPIIGPSGASAFFRLSALGEIRFDERFFMYKEDCDLAYQLFLAGKKSAVVASALVYHDRSVIKGRRSAKSRQARLWSFYGQHLLLKKYWRQQSLWSKMGIVLREIAMLGYVLVFERCLLKELKKVKSNS